MTKPLYAITAVLDRHQKNCRLTLTIDGDKIPLSFDDAIEFKIQIARIQDTGFPSVNEVAGTIDQWKAQFFPNKGGFSIAVRHPARSITTLALNKRQTERFLEDLQHFIDQAGQRS
jgi:hypothetical protein